MNFKKYIPYLLIIFLFLLLFLRPVNQQIVGNDSYYFLNYIFGYNTDIAQAPIISQFIFNILPANILIIRIVMLLVSLLSVYIIIKCAELYNKQNGWIAGLIITCTPFFLKFLFEFEDDLFAKPVLFLAMYFIIKYQRDSSTKHIIISLVLLFISALIWKMSIFWFIMFIFMTNFNKIYLFCSIGLLYFINSLIGYLFAGLSFYVSEYIMGFYLLSISFILLFSLNKKIMIAKNKIAVYVFLILSFLNSKILVVLYPLLCFNISNYWQKYPESVRIMIVLYLSVSFIVSSVSFLNALPNNNKNELFDISHELKNNNYTNLEVKPYWGFGHYYIWWSKNYYSDYGSYKPTPPDGIIITYNWDKLDCPEYYRNNVGKILICE